MQPVADDQPRAGVLGPHEGLLRERVPPGRPVQVPGAEAPGERGVGGVVAPDLRRDDDVETVPGGDVTDRVDPGVRGRLAVAAGNVLACSALIGFIACSDGGITEPATGRTAAVTQPRADVAPNWWNYPAPVVRGDTTVDTFTMDAHAGGTPSFGPNKIHQIVIPGDAICNLKSGYGQTYWNQACTPAVGNVTFTVKSWKGSDGSPRVAFSPDLRFAPSQTVLLKLSTSTTSTASASIRASCCSPS